MDENLEEEFRLPAVLVDPAKLLMVYAMFTNTAPDKLSAMARDLAVALKLSHIEVMGDAMPNIDDYAIVMERTAIRDQEAVQAELLALLDSGVKKAFRTVSGRGGC